MHKYLSRYFGTETSGPKSNPDTSGPIPRHRDKLTFMNSWPNKLATQIEVIKEIKKIFLDV
jgi:hypothetical protein